MPADAGVMDAMARGLLPLDTVEQAASPFLVPRVGGVRDSPSHEHAAYD
jgi:hypothetical protein